MRSKVSRSHNVRETFQGNEEYRTAKWGETCVGKGQLLVSMFIAISSEHAGVGVGC